MTKTSLAEIAANAGRWFGELVAMDSRRRPAQPLKRQSRPASPAGASGRAPVRGRRTRVARQHPSRLGFFLHRWWMRLMELRPPRFAGVLGSALLILSSIGYGVVK